MIVIKKGFEKNRKVLNAYKVCRITITATVLPENHA